MESQISEMESLLIQADDLGAYSVSEFLSLMPSQLSWVDNKSISHLKIFCSSQGHHIQLNSNKVIAAAREKIKSALEGLDIFRLPTLVQLWMPKTLGSQQFLVTSDLPFGINLLRKGLCMYRKLCSDYKYDLDCEEELGPIGRVFRNGVPEFSPYVSCYSTKEFKLRDCAVSCGVYGYLVWPVFESAGNQCVCVLELITVFDGNYYLTDAIKKVAEAIKAVGLRSYNAHWPLDIERSSQHEFALSEIEKGLKVVCYTHNIPFAQTWFACPKENHIGSVMSTSEKGSIMLAKRVSSFQKDCIQFGLKKGQNVAWAAFASCSSWFCKDVKQLNINEYPLVLSARKVDLTGCFAICLQSTSTGNEVYVLEFFLPSNETFYRRPQTLLNSILVAVKEHFQSFKVAFIQEPGADIAFNIIKLDRDDELDSATTQSQPVPQNKVETLHHGRNFSATKHDNFTALPNKGGVGNSGKQLEYAECIFDASIPEEKHLHRNQSINRPSTKRKADRCLSNKDGRVSKNYNTGQARYILLPEEDTTSVAHPASQAAESEAKIMFKASFKEDIIKFQLSLSSGIMDFVNEVKKRLQLTTGSFEIKYQNEDNNCISLASDADLQNLMFDMMSQKKNTVKVLLEPVQDQHLEEDTTSAAHPASQAAESEAKIMFKALFKEDIIKFQLSLSSGIMDFVNEVKKRLQLTTGIFEIKYQNEDNNCISLASDADLQNLMFDTMSQKKNTVKVLLEPVQNQHLESSSISVACPAPRTMPMQNESTVTILATYKEETVNFQLSLLSGFQELNGQLMKRLNLRDDSFQIMSLGDANKWMPVASDIDLHTCIDIAKSQDKPTIRLAVKPFTNQLPGGVSNSVSPPTPQVMTNQIESLMTIKVTYKEDIIKFQLPPSSGLMQLKDAVTKRLKLSSESFEVKYQDEDNKWIYLSTDAELQNHLSAKRLSDRLMVKLHLSP